jgi:hypothetical protein
MKRVGLAVALIAALALALSLSAFGGAGAQVTTLRFTQVQATEHFVDLPPKGPGPGDMDVITTNLMSGGKVVGHGKIVGIVVDFPNVEIIRTDILPGGHISSLDTFNASAAKTEDLAIVGGTGVYSKVRGHITLTHPSATKVAVVFTINE